MITIGQIFAIQDAEDGSTTIEFVCADRRLGFVFQPEGESSWFTVLPDGTSGSGGFDRQTDLWWLVEDVKKFREPQA